MARRRGPGVVWLPASTDDRLGTEPNTAASSGATPSAGIISLAPPAFGPDPNDGDTVFAALVKDEPQGVGTAVAEGSLSDIEGSAYRLRRIVGKIFVQSFQDAPVAGQPTQFLVTIGIIVLRVGDDGNPLNSSTTLGYSPQRLDAVRDPWIWRRNWRVANNQPLIAAGAPPVTSPASNFAPGAYGSVFDGPHVDAKTARVISDEERLFLVANAISLDGAEDSQDSGSLLVIWDLRVLASMRKQSGNRRNASR